MNRRYFLKTSMAAAGALVTGVGCGSDGEGDSGGRVLIEEPGFFPQSVASGDPKPESVILWTRVSDSARSAEALSVKLEVALDELFLTRVSLSGGADLAQQAEPEFNHCVKVRVTGLKSGTSYYYRFIYESKDGSFYVSRTGRTRTAPALSEDVAVRFAVVSCQDYSARYYNTMRHLGTLEVDFIVHLGDYIYESVGNASFQDSDAAREVSFRSPEEALVVHPGAPNEYLAAKSLGNYRDLYEIYRSDSDLQSLHERYPFVVIWDDHEFSNDCWGATGTYTAGAEDERDVERRQAANQAWFEFMPVDFRGAPDFRYDGSVAFPGDMEIYRDFYFGKNLHLVMTDLRSYRGDHPLPEKSAPWGVAALAEDLEQYRVEIESLPGVNPEEGVGPYMLAGESLGEEYRSLLEGEAERLGIPEGERESALSGPLSVEYLNQMITDAGEGAPAPLETEGLPRGIANHHLGKWAYHSANGSRQLVVSGPCRILSLVNYLKTGGASEEVMGRAQEEWFLSALKGSDRTWKVWGNEFVFAPMVVDVVGMVSSPRYSQRFHVSGEDWHATPTRRDRLLEEFLGIDNFVAITGDVHAFYASALSDGAGRGMMEFVTGGLSSKTYRDMLLATASSDPDLVAAGAAGLAVGIDQILQNPMKKTNPHLAFAESNKNGFLIMEARSTELLATCYMIDGRHVSEMLGAGSALAGKFEERRFRVGVNSVTLESEVEGEWQRWYPATMEWGPSE